MSNLLGLVLAPLLMYPLSLSVGLPDRGIWPELDQGLQIAPPDFPVVASQESASLRLRLDLTHHVLTVYRGEAVLTAYPIPAGKDIRATWPEILQDLRTEDAEALKTLAGAAPVLIQRSVPQRAEDQDGDGVVDSLDILLGAKKLIKNKAAYREEYRSLKYPMGDVPRNEGVCTDTVIRALRNAGWDLQKEVHEEVLRMPQIYPLEKGKKPDSNIDHRRVRMLVPWFNRHFLKLKPGQPLRPGDIVFLDTFPNKAGADHLGIVSDHKGISGHPVLINNWTNGFVEQEMDLLAFVPVLFVYRAKSNWQVEPK